MRSRCLLPTCQFNCSLYVCNRYMLNILCTCHCWCMLSVDCRTRTFNLVRLFLCGSYVNAALLPCCMIIKPNCNLRVCLNHAYFRTSDCFTFFSIKIRIANWKKQEANIPFIRFDMVVGKLNTSWM